jgi:2-amino-4-hydroxy-6-hydroxymethyldihydropteridine diphosphokinase
VRHRNVFLGIGCNVGDCPNHIRQAEKKIAEIAEISLRSSVYVTRAYGNEDQERFLNRVILVNTDFSPGEFMEKLLNIEKEAGRRAHKKWAPRIIDIDIIFWDKLVIEEEELTVPHYDYKNRDFFLVPAAEIFPGFIPPDSDEKLISLAEKVKEKTIISKEKAFEPVYSG